MDVYALDSSFNLVTIAIPYDYLRWQRRYYMSGEFLMKVPQAIYDDSWAYIGTANRPELGMVQKMASDNSDEVILAGFFCEKMLDEKVCYPRYIGDVQKTETAVRNIFAKYKGDLPVILGDANDPLLGDRTQSDFSDDELGQKLFSILESRELSYRVRFDYVNSKLYMEVWQGLDRTQSQNINSTQVFSLEFGNILKRTVDMDESDYKNYAIIPVNSDDNGKERATYYLDVRTSSDERRRDIVFDMRSSKPEDGETTAHFKDSVLQEAREKIADLAKVDEVDIQVLSDTGYMRDYDLGDKCEILLTDLGIQMESRIVEVDEVFTEADGHKITVGLGNKRIRRAVL